ncbi:MAG: hypothetical protein R3F55_01325 [Alphaproteobacteria bacterium]
MTQTTRRPAPHAGIGRRRLLQGALGAGALGAAGGMVSRRANAQTGLVALVHTQAAGDSGPVDSA